MSAHKDRLIAAAELLGMDPGDLLAKLDPPAVDLGPATGTGAADRLLIRIHAELAYLNIMHDIDSPVRSLLDAVSDLDAHLSAGGTPPEAWREGPDAPELTAEAGAR